MSDPDETQTAPAVKVPEVSGLVPVEESNGAVDSICDTLKELFRRAPKAALSLVCASVAAFVVMCGIGIMIAFISYGWPTMAAKQVQNWELKNDNGTSVVELRSRDDMGEMMVETVEVPVDVPDAHEWAVSKYGEQKPLTEIPILEKPVLEEKD